MFVERCNWILKVSLDRNMPVVIYEVNCQGSCLASFENGGTLFFNQHRSSIYKISDDNIMMTSPHHMI